MFEGLKGKFEIYSISNSKSKDPTLRPIEVKIGAKRCLDLACDLLKERNYKTIQLNETYQEIFSSKAGYEITISCESGSDGTTTINISVYGPNHRGLTRKALRSLLHGMNEKLKNG